MKIDPEFERIIPPLTAEEYRGLEENVLSEGCRDALILWGDILIDGHNRYRICSEHNIAFRTIQKEFTNRDEAKIWIMNNQLSRRNLNDFQRIEIVRKCENAVKAQAKIRQEATQFGGGGKITTTAEKSRDTLGSMAGVSGKTYEHAGEVIDKAPEAVLNAVRQNNLSINAAYETTKLPEEMQSEISMRIQAGENPRNVIQEVSKRPHVSYNTGNNEWYTPSEYIELARNAMGSIDLDPASSELANKVVQAKKIYTLEDDGLKQDWYGNVWLNPPYSTDLIMKFAEKLSSELNRINQAIVLVNNATETEWFHKLVKKSSALCFPSGRVKFYRPDGTSGAPLQGQAIIYYGNQAKKFINVFRSKGWCVMPCEI